MKKTVNLLMLMALLTGVLFTGCMGNDVEVSDEKEVLEESVEEMEEDDSEEELDANEDEVSDEGELGMAREQVDKSEEAVEEEPASNPPSLSITLPSGDEEEGEEVEEDAGSDSEADATVTVYKNGTYTQTASYQAPPGEESMGVSLVIENDLVKSVSVTPNDGHDVSSQYKSQFAAAISGKVVGMSLEEIDSISAVSGASLTTLGFKNAVKVIKAEAKS